MYTPSPENASSPIKSGRKLVFAVVECGRGTSATPTQIFGVGGQCGFFSNQVGVSLIFSWHEVASRTLSTLVSSATAAISALCVSGSRNLLLTLDETVWHPMWDLMSGLRPEPASQMAYIGGYIDAEEDWSFMERGSGHLPSEKLSKMSVHFALSRCDTNRHVYGIDMIPRPPKKLSEQSTQGLRWPANILGLCCLCSQA